jgi:hypothetical protein
MWVLKQLFTYFESVLFHCLLQLLCDIHRQVRNMVSRFVFIKVKIWTLDLRIMSRVLHHCATSILIAPLGGWKLPLSVRVFFAIEIFVCSFSSQISQAGLINFQLRLIKSTRFSQVLNFLLHRQVIFWD